MVFQFGRTIKVKKIFRRFPDERWNLQKIHEINATPTNPNLGNPNAPNSTFKFKSDAIVESGKNATNTPIVGKKAKLKNSKITKKLFEEHGYIDGCVGCETIGSGMPKRNHTKYCRTRMTEELNKTQKGRATIKRNEERLMKNRDDNHPANDQRIEEKFQSEREKGFDVEDGDNAMAFIGGTGCERCNPTMVKEILTRFEGEIQTKKSANIENNEATNDVNQIYSFPKITAKAPYHGLRQRCSLDLTN